MFVKYGQISLPEADRTRGLLSRQGCHKILIEASDIFGFISNLDLGFSHEIKRLFRNLIFFIQSNPLTLKSADLTRKKGIGLRDATQVGNLAYKSELYK